MSARANVPDEAKAREELDAKMSPIARELEEPVAKNEADTYHNRREGLHAQKGDREQLSTTRAGANTPANPDEIRIEGDAAGEGQRNGARIKARKSLMSVAARGSHLQSNDGGSVPQGEGLPTNLGPRAPKFG